MNMKMRDAALLWMPAFLLVGCLMSRLKIDESATGSAGSGGADSADAGRSSGGANPSGGDSPAESGSTNGEGGGAADAGGGGASSAGKGGAQNTAGAQNTGGAQNTAGAQNTGGAQNMAGAQNTGGAGGAPPDPLLAVKKSAGCGKDPAQAAGTTVKSTIATMGTKPAGCADGLCGDWQYTREYALTLPTGYDKNKAYPLVLQGPGCGGDSTTVYTLSGPNANVNGAVIRVGLTPPPNTIQHSTNPGQGCFDDKEGDDSVDFVFYETLRDKLKNEICFDENRVFASGESSGGSLANELGCKYAGNTQGYAIRGVAVNTGGLPTTPAYAPTCTTKPMAGMWIHELADPVQPFSGNKIAINRAMQVNGCTGANYDTATFQDYPIGGGQPDTTCKRIVGCPALYPLVVCALPGSQHASHPAVANPGFSTFLSAFLSPPLAN